MDDKKLLKSLYNKTSKPISFENFKTVIETVLFVIESNNKITKREISKFKRNPKLLTIGFRTGFGTDSMIQAEISMALEEEFNIEIDDEEFYKCICLQKVIDYLGTLQIENRQTI